MQHTATVKNGGRERKADELKPFNIANRVMQCLSMNETTTENWVDENNAHDKKTAKKIMNANEIGIPSLIQTDSIY